MTCSIDLLDLKTKTAGNGLLSYGVSVSPLPLTQNAGSAKYTIILAIRTLLIEVTENKHFTLEKLEP